MQNLLGCTLPFSTPELAGVGGATRALDEHFCVEEIPSYRPSGQGEHLFLWIEKRGLSTEQLVRHIARTLNVDSRDIGTAGLKDRHAVTRQWVSVPANAVADPDVLNVAETGKGSVRVLEAARHGNKLKTGHLRGNRFSVVIGEVTTSALSQARIIAEALQAHGVANFYGPQRFGFDFETPRMGLELMRGNAPEQLARAPRARHHFLRKLALSSVQSALFNMYLQRRMAESFLHTVVEGEVMQVVASGGPFWATQPELEQRRFEAREIVPAGPIFGPKMRACAAGSLAAMWEAAILESCELNLAMFAAQGKTMLGTRRACVVWPSELEVAPHHAGLEVRFVLPPGSYATIVMREFMKNENNILE